MKVDVDPRLFFIYFCNYLIFDYRFAYWEFDALEEKKIVCGRSIGIVASANDSTSKIQTETDQCIKNWNDEK